MANKSIYKCIPWMTMITILISTGLLFGQAKEKEKKLTKKNVPAAVISAFEKAYPKATIKGLSKEVEKGTTYYEIETVDGKTKRDLLYTADGKVQEIEETISVSDMPKEVQASLNKEYPKVKVDKAEKLTKGETVQYELKIKVGKKTREVVFDPSGKILKGDKHDKEKGEKEENEEEEED